MTKKGSLLTAQNVFPHAFHVSLVSIQVCIQIFRSYDALLASSGRCGYACLHLCAFVSVITIASCAADKSLG